MGSIRVITAASCCEYCAKSNPTMTYQEGTNPHSKSHNKGKRCTGFTFVGGVCYLKACEVKQVKDIVQIFKRHRDPSMVELNAISAYIKFQ